MSDHALPTTSTYAVDLINAWNSRIADVMQANDPATVSLTNQPVNTVRFSGAVSKWQKWNGTTWVDLVATYAISISGLSATATALATARNINGVSFNGTANITVTANTTQALTFNNGGAGAASGSTFNGSTATTISYNSIGAPKSDGTGASGTWAIAISGLAATATTAAALGSGGTIATDVAGVTQAAKDATSKVATTEFVDRLRSLLASTTTGTAVVGDRGCLVPITANFTIPASVFSGGDVFTIYNATAGNLSLLQGSGLTFRLAGTALTGNRTLSQRGLVVITFISGTEALVSGSGVS
jgi:hypothetical protein